MQPSRLRRPLLLAVVSLAFGLAGCNKPTDEDASPTENLIAAQPSPTPVPDRTGRKALGAYNAVSQYLKEQDPELRDKLHRAAERFVKDKDKWRSRLQNQQRSLQPRIAQARAQLTRVEGKSTEALRNIRQELASLESQHAEADRRLSELDSITSDTWKSFRERLKLDDEPTASPASSPK